MALSQIQVSCQVTKHYATGTINWTVVQRMKENGSREKNQHLIHWNHLVTTNLGNLVT